MKRTFAWSGLALALVFGLGATGALLARRAGHEPIAEAPPPVTDSTLSVFVATNGACAWHRVDPIAGVDEVVATLPAAPRARQFPCDAVRTIWSTNGKVGLLYGDLSQNGGLIRVVFRPRSVTAIPILGDSLVLAGLDPTGVPHAETIGYPETLWSRIFHPGAPHAPVTTVARFERGRWVEEPPSALGEIDFFGRGRAEEDSVRAEKAAPGDVADLQTFGRLRWIEIRPGVWMDSTNGSGWDATTPLWPMVVRRRGRLERLDDLPGAGAKKHVETRGEFVLVSDKNRDGGYPQLFDGNATRVWSRDDVDGVQFWPMSLRPSTAE